jgi:hypothetical protein
MSADTRADKVERHFRNSVQKSLLELMKIMDPGNQKNWNYQSYAELLKYARNRIDAELLHETGFEEELAVELEVEMTESSVEKPLNPSEPAKSHLALELPEQTRLS